MPKNKTHSGAKKRFKVTGSGKILREKAGKRHNLEKKPPRSPAACPARLRSPRPTSSAPRRCSVSDPSAAWPQSGLPPDFLSTKE
jgi:hypothetical protein